MPQINVNIDGKTYRMACGEGEEAHLTQLAETFGSRIGEMRQAFGEIGDMRLQVMAALTLSDELSETRRRLMSLEAEAATLRAEAGRVEAERSADAERCAAGLRTAAERVEQMSRALSASAVRETR